MMTRARRAKWIIRLSLLALLLFFASVFAILLHADKHAISPGVAKELLQQWESGGSSSGSELVSLLGSPTEEKMTSRGKHLAWLFDPESLFDSHQFGIVADIDHEDHVFAMMIGETIYAGGYELWKYRWYRLKKRLGLN